jgi:Flp pilus assembly protein TadD
MNTYAAIEDAARALNAGDASKSIAICKAALDQDPTNAFAAHILGLSLKDIGDVAHAESWLRASIRLDPTRADYQANLGNLLRQQGKYFKAQRFYRRALELAPNHIAARRSLALTLVDLQSFEEAEAQCRSLLALDSSDCEAWVILGMSLAGKGELGNSENAYRKAIELDPENKIAHHNLGALLIQMEKPESALVLLDKAQSLGDNSYELAFNKGRALLENYQIEQAESEFVRATALRPTSADAQLTLARIRFMQGDPKFARTLASAVAVQRDNVELQLLLGQILWRSGKYEEASTVVHDLLVRKGENPHAQAVLSRILHESGNLEDAETHAVSAATIAPNEPEIIESLVNILLSRNRPEDAAPFIEIQRRKSPLSQAWIAYEATAARALGKELHNYLYDYDRLVKVFELDAPAGWSSISEFNDALKAALNERHKFLQHPLDQTLRNGTQTSRSLLSESNEVIRSVLKAFETPISNYREYLGNDSLHPMSSRNFGDTEMTGAWSVRLNCQGFHVNHFHPDGWLSSAYYVDIPKETEDPQSKSGWIKFGEPRYKIPNLTPERFIQPRAGQLVLFPSYMWHGTTPIFGGEHRMSIAFDVVPRQSKT